MNLPFFLPWTPESRCQYISSPLTPLVKVFLYHLCFFMFPRYPKHLAHLAPHRCFHPYRHRHCFFTSIKYIIRHINYITSNIKINEQKNNHLDGDPMIRVWDQEVCSFCGLRFEPCGCSYDGHWRLTWSLTSGLVGLVEVRASWPGHPR